MEIIKTNIPMKDVSKVMKEVGYNVATPNKSSAIAEQLAEANARPQKSMGDAINRAMEKVTLRKTGAVAVPISLPKTEAPKPIAKPVIKVVEKPKELLKTDGKEERKTVTIDMTTINTAVSFTGKGWTAKNIRMAYNSLVKAFRIKIREEYRKGTK
jgi:predicted helicase